MANTVFQRYQYNFDSNKFGSAIEIGSEAKNMLDVASNNTTFSSWQINDLADNVVSRERYFKNPVKNVTITLIDTIDNFGETVNNTSFTVTGAQHVANYLNPNTINRMISLLSDFISHTNNVSGVSANTGTTLVPTYDTITAFANENIIILNKTNKIANSVGALGAMTSLFIGDDIIANTTLFNEYRTLIINNTTFSTCSLSASQMETMNVAFNGLYNEIYNRINGDWLFYQNTLNVSGDYSFLSRFSTPSNTQLHLINNYIGTDYLKSKITT